MGEFYNNQWRLLNNENKDKSSNYSMSFDGSSQYIDLGPSNSIITGNTVSVSIWFKTTATARYYLFQNKRSSISTNISLEINNESTGGLGSVGAVVWSNPHRFLQYRDNSNLCNNGNWHNLVVTATASKLTLYYDGEKVDEFTDSFVNESSSDSSFIGLFSSTSTVYFNGKLDHLSIFDYALSDGGVSVNQTAGGQISDLYGNSTNGVGDPMSLSTKPVAYYKLGEKAAFNGSEYLVTNSASEVFSPYALDFDGTEYIDLNPAVSTSNEYTVSAWLNSNDLTSSGAGYIVGTSDNKGISLFEGGQGDAGKFYYWNGTTAITISSTAITINNWFNVIFIINETANEIKFYLNGNLDKTTTVTSISGNINKIASFGGHHINAKLSNVSIFNTALTDGTGSTPNQISELYSSGKPSDLNTHSAASNLVSWWQLGANSSFISQWTVLDEVGTSNGTSYGMAENDLVNGPGTTANGLSSGMGSGNNVIGEAPYSTANALSIDMGVEARSDDTPS